MTDEALFEACQSEVKFISRQFRLTREDAEDLAMDAFFKLKNNPCALRESPNPRSYVQTIIKRMNFDNHRKNIFRGEEIKTNQVEVFGVSSNDSFDAISNADYLGTLLDRVEPIHRDALIAHMEYKSAKICAKVLGISVPAFNSRFYRGQAQLEEIYRKSRKKLTY